MKNNNQKPNSDSKNGLGHGGLKLLIDSLADLITKLRVDLLVQGNEILGKIREVNDSVDIIAREIGRQAEGGKKS